MTRIEKISRPAEPPAVPSAPAADPPTVAATSGLAERPLEIGGRDGPDPTRYGDWELKGRCVDF